MSERGILFRGEMVRAILDGRKTVTRRIIKPQPEAGDLPLRYNNIVFRGKYGWETAHGRRLPRQYLIGDKLWVRETWWGVGETEDSPALIAYRANILEHDPDWKWKPAIHMPRWASRILLEVEDVDIKRLPSLRGVDAMQEGFQPIEDQDGRIVKGVLDVFKDAWCEMHGKDSWSDDTLVWVIKFKRIE